MNLKLDLNVARRYVSSSQKVRVLTERWVSEYVYCPSCGNEKLNQFDNNKPVADFFCLFCSSEYELKSKKDTLGKKIVDGAYSTMLARISADNNPNFFFLNYSSDFHIRNFLVIPKHYFVADIIEERKPLAENARRAGWTGCNILLHNIPEAGKIYFVKNGLRVKKEQVLETWSKTDFLSKQKKESRSWIIEMLRIIDMLPSAFSLADVYRFEPLLQQKFPHNNFVKDKIRQQLQVLRDKGLLEFSGKGTYIKTEV